jgi:hypothetical protein
LDTRQYYRMLDFKKASIEILLPDFARSTNQRNPSSPFVFAAD